MQQPPPMMNMMPPFPPNSITTEQIQKYLDENKTLILAILDNQNLGKLAECAQYQAQLQKNLMYLAAIADAQPQAPAMPPSQMPQHPTMQPGGHMMQHPQAGASQQLTGFPPKSPLQFNPQQMQEQQRQQLQHQHHQALQGHMGIRPGVNNGLHGMHTENNLGAGSSGGPSATGGSTGLNDFSRSGGGPGGGTNTSASVSPSPGLGTGASSNSMDAREGKQDGQEAGPDDGQGNSAAGNNSANGEVSNKGPEDAK